jgi:hypothetical protein
VHNLCRYCADEQDSVRLLAVEDCAALGRLLPKEECVFEAGFRVGLVFATFHGTVYTTFHGTLFCTVKTRFN